MVGSPRSYLPSLYVTVLISAIYAVMEWFTPFQYDNLMFDATYLIYSGGSSDFSLDAYMKYIDRIKDVDNWRLANILAPASTIILDSKLIFSILCGLCMGLNAYLGAWFAEGDRRPSAGTIVAVWALMIIALPWRNNLLTGDYALNYIFGATLSLVTLWFIVQSLRRNRWWLECSTMLMCLLTGLWHEGFAIPLSVGIVCYIAVRRAKLPERIWFYAVVNAVTAVVWVVFSRQHERVGRELLTFTGLHGTIRILASNFMTVAMCVFLALSLSVRFLRDNIRRCAAHPGFVVLSGCAVAGMAMSLMVRHTDRMAMWPQMCSLITVVALWRQPSVDTIRRPVRNTVALAIVAACILQSVYAIKYLAINDAVHSDIMSQVASRKGGGAVYADVLFPEDYPALTLGMIPRSTFVETYTYRCIDGRYGRKDVAVVPTALRRMTVAACDTLGGTPVVMLVNGEALVYADGSAPYGDRRCGIGLADITMTDGQILRGHQFFHIAFDASDGKRYVYVKPLGIHSSDVKSFIIN